MQAKQNHQKLYTQGFRVSDELRWAPEKTIIESESWSVSAICPGPWSILLHSICLRSQNAFFSYETRPWIPPSTCAAPVLTWIQGSWSISKKRSEMKYGQHWAMCLEQYISIERETCSQSMDVRQHISLKYVGKKIASWILLRNRGIKKCCQWFFFFNF
jgi:hypothetical protein